jgi:hypothetical protein
MPKDKKYYQGKFNPQNPQKYNGNYKNIIYRSSWELHFMRYCDRNENILEWGSEEIFIPYISPLDNKIHRYFPDFFVKIQEKTGNIKKYIIEIKPKKQTIPPIKKTKITKSFIYEATTYEVNKAKWKAAEEFCKDHMIYFKIITEDDLNLGINYSNK